MFPIMSDDFSKNSFNPFFVLKETFETLALYYISGKPERVHECARIK